MKKIFTKLFENTKVERKLYAAAVLYSIFIALLNIVYLYYIKKLVNSIIDVDFSVSLIYIGAILAVNLTKITLERLSSLHLNEMTINLSTIMNIKFYRKLNKIPLDKLAKYKNADILTRSRQDLDSIVKFFTVSLVGFFSNLISFIFIVLYIAFNNVYLLWVLLIVPILIISSKKVTRKKNLAYKNRQTQASDVNIIAKDIFDNSKNIQDFSATDFFLKKYKKIDDSFVEIDKKCKFYDTILWILSVMSYQILYILFYVGGGYLAYIGALSFGVVVSLFISIDPLINYMQSIANFLYSVPEIKVNLARVNEILDIEDYEKIENIKLSKDYSVEFIDVCYSYGESDVKALNNVNLRFDSNENVVIIGKSGSGKSTLLKLLLGYDANYNGKILINGQKIEDLGTEVIKKVISYLPQEITFLQQPIKENIDIMLDKSYSKEDVESYAKIASIANDTIINKDGNDISIGQKQRIGILFTLLKETHFSILDECFSGIDISMSTTILENLVNNNKKGLIIVTHTNTLTISKLFDRVIIFDDSKVVLDGTYNEVKDTKIFQELTLSQEVQYYDN